MLSVITSTDWEHRPQFIPGKQVFLDFDNDPVSYLTCYKRELDIRH